MRAQWPLAGLTVDGLCWRRHCSAGSKRRLAGRPTPFISFWARPLAFPPSQQSSRAVITSARHLHIKHSRLWRLVGGEARAAAPVHPPVPRSRSQVSAARVALSRPTLDLDGNPSREKSLRSGFPVELGKQSFSWAAKEDGRVMSCCFRSTSRVSGRACTGTAALPVRFCSQEVELKVEQVARAAPPLATQQPCSRVLWEHELCSQLVRKGTASMHCLRDIPSVVCRACRSAALIVRPNKVPPLSIAYERASLTCLCDDPGRMEVRVDSWWAPAGRRDTVYRGSCGAGATSSSWSEDLPRKEGAEASVATMEGPMFAVCQSTWPNMERQISIRRHRTAGCFPTGRATGPESQPRRLCHCPGARRKL